MQMETVNGFRLSPQQERLWALHEADGSRAYVAACAVEIAGRLDRRAFRAALDEVVGRQEILRTAFRRLPEMTIPVQVINGGGVSYEEHDLTGLGEEAQARRLGEGFAEARRRSFDYEYGPALAAVLYGLAPERHAFVLSAPALCADAVSLRNLLGELSQSYAAAVAGRSLDGEPLQYADIAEWLNELLEAEGAALGREYWLGQEIPASPALPFETEPAGGEPFNCESVRVRAGAERVVALEALASRLGATSAEVLLACWYVLLWRHTGQSELAVGVESEGRKYEQLKDALGPFAKSLPVRCDVRADEGFVELLGRVAGAAREAERWQESFSWETFLGGASRAGEDGRLPSHAFAFEDLTARYEAAGVAFELREQHVCAERFTLRLCARRRADGLDLEFDFDPARLSAEWVARLADGYVQLLAGVLADTAAPVETYAVCGPVEREQLLRDYNRTGADFTTPRLLHAPFEAQAARTPDAVAIVSEGVTFTYAELDRRASHLARHLRARGVGPDVLVGVCVERSPEMAWALLGILKAGGAYLPLDPAAPRERLALMLDDARPRLVVTAQPWRAALPAPEEEVVYLDAVPEVSDAPEGGGAHAEPTPDHLAYVIYTSGSTGRPKGVMVSHRSICNRLLWMQQAYPLDGSDTLLQKTVYGFDASVWELFVPLLAGARLVLARPGGQQDPAYLVEAVVEHQVTVLQLVPSMFGVWLKEEGAAGCRSLRRVFCGGEALPLAAAAEFHRMFSAELVNLYGPTEASIDATAWRVSPEEAAAGGVRAIAPIGRAIANMRVYILDRSLNPVPHGVGGELHIAGVGLARGYLGRPALTAERFIPDPFSSEPGGRLYHTGDVARYRADGAVEFLGRSDDQVKLRGYRIEVGEIEAALRHHEGVVEAAVALREDVPGDQRLVAYVVARRVGEAAPELSAGELQQRLRRVLPEYMLPSTFVMLDALPSLPNGKVDRRALPAPDLTRDARDAQGTQPRTPFEESLAGIWADVLGVERVGSHDNFFELGGHSLLATQVVSRVRKALHAEVTLRGFFESPTVAGLATRVEAERKAAGKAGAPPLERAGQRDEGFPLSFSQQRLWFIDQLAPGNAVYNIPMSFRLSGELNVRALERTLAEIIRRHEVLRTTFEARDGRPVQLVASAADFTLPLVELSELAPEERERRARELASEDAQAPFDLARGPLLRAALLRLAPREHVFLCTLHHIVSDAWSVGILVKEVAALYEAFAANRPSPLPELPIQYADFAVWQRRWLSGETLERHLEYWRRKLGGVPPVLRLEGGGTGPGAADFRGAARGFTLPGELSTALRALSRREGGTLFMTLLAAFAALLQRRSGQEDIVVGTDVANRNRVETEPLVGFFVNQLVLRADLSGDPTFRELLARVRAVTLEAYDHQDLPFERLVEELNPDRALSQTPLFQTKLVLQNVGAPELGLEGLTLSPLGDEAAETETAKFDLYMTVADMGGALEGRLGYSTALFGAEFVEGLLRQFEALLASAVADPDTRLSQLELASEAERAELEAERLRRRESNLRRFKSASPRTVKVSRQQLVRTQPLTEGRDLPLLFEPNIADVDVFDWVADHRELVESNLLRHGGLLFRGFGLGAQADFEQYVKALGLPLMKYMEGATPRTELKEKIYTSTEYPADHVIALHNELTYTLTWPLKICFFCVQAPAVRGETPIADVRRVLHRLGPRVVERFRARGGWMLVRNFREGLSLPWQKSFNCADEAEAEAYFRGARIDWEWKAGGRELVTRQVRPTTARHPRTGEEVWFNHIAFWHVSSLEPEVRETLLATMGEENLPYNTYYGDGSPIEDSLVEEIREAYREETVYFPWQVGDLLLLDNMLVAHGRNSYRGERKILAAMGEAYTRADAAAAPTE
jgi:amino acid adenylation domain-containing protein